MCVVSCIDGVLMVKTPKCCVGIVPTKTNPFFKGEWKMKKLLLCLLAIALTAGVAQADFFDDFEDGDASDWDLLSPGGSTLDWSVEAPGAGGSDYSLN